jgi:pyrroline-5-carboxylate reductase
MAKLPKTALIGLGNMGEALLAGLLKRGAAKASDIVGVEARGERGKEIADRYGIRTATEIAKGARDAQLIVLAVKPKDADAALRALGKLDGKVLISICAGLTLDWFAARVSAKTAVVRVMPNTPALIGEGASVYCPGAGVPEAALAHVETLLGAVGRVYRVSDEKLMDAVTGLSGSGPAFVFLFLEALADGGVASGLPRELARELAAQTVLGSALMARESPEHTAELKDRVCSPAGTTIEGVRRLEGAGFRSAVIEAVTAATKRSRELGG